MLCKVCNTRLGATERQCLNCGQDAPAESAYARTTQPGPLPSPDLSTAREEDDEIVELNEVSGEAPLPPPKKKKAAPKKPEKTAAKAAPRKAPEEAPKMREPAPLFAPDPAGLRALLAGSPDALEAGLSVYRDEDGRAVGADYNSGVGEIDLLATDAHGGLVVVMISEKGQGEELIAEVLQRVGWVRKHVADASQKVRGIVLCEAAPEGLSYAAAAVADTVSFKTYRVALRFDDLEI